MRADPSSSVLYDAGPQSGARAPAPGRLALVQAFVNSRFDLEEQWGEDLFATPGGLQRWLQARGLPAARVTRAELARTLTVREGLRAQFAEHNGRAADLGARAAFREASRGLGAAFELDAAGATVPVPACTGVAGALGLLLAVAHESRTAGGWTRLKTCPGHHCGWVFYDRSRNGGGTWCSMRVCGGREKARAYRRRSLAPASPT